MTLSKLCSVPEKERSDDIKQEILDNERKVNRAVAKLYRLTPSEISLVKNY
jgi:hypothetical protein